MTETRKKAAIVTGGNGSIGRAVVNRFHTRGLPVVSADLQVVDHADVVADVQIHYDASSRQSARDVVNAVPEGHDIAHLVLAAGIYPERDLHEMPDDEWQSCLDVNLTGAYRLIQAALPRLSPDASVVLIGSIAGLRGSRGHSHYATSKAGLLGLMRSLMWELGGQRRINTVSPGIIDNPMTDSLRSSAGSDILRGTPMGRYGQPDEVAGVVDFLCSPAATFVQGENISVNGGFYVN